MTLVGCDLHSRKQQVAALDTTTGEVLEQELVHEGDAVERFYRALRQPVTIGIETTGYTQWFHTLMRQLGHTVIVGEAAEICSVVVRKTKDLSRLASRQPPFHWRTADSADEHRGGTIAGTARRRFWTCLRQAVSSAPLRLARVTGSVKAEVISKTCRWSDHPTVG